MLQKSTFLVLCSRFVLSLWRGSLCAFSPRISSCSPRQESQRSRVVGVGAVCWCTATGSISLELGCFQPALLCQVLLIQERVVGVFPLGRRSAAAFSLLCLVASLGRWGGSAATVVGDTQPCVGKQGRNSQFPRFQCYSYAAELQNDKKNPKQHLKGKLFHHTQLLFPAPSDLCSPPQGCSSISWCWPHGLP